MIKMPQDLKIKELEQLASPDGIVQISKGRIKGVMTKNGGKGVIIPRDGWLEPVCHELGITWITTEEKK